MKTNSTLTASPIVYFDQEGRENLHDVVRVLKRLIKKREDLREKKIVVFTAYGEGPVLAYNFLNEFEPTIIAVTFPPDFSVKRGDERHFPSISDKLLKFFSGVGVEVITNRLPFDRIDGADSHNREIALIENVLRLFGGGLIQCVQAILSACDAGKVCKGEQVIAFTGDWAILATASNTKSFLDAKEGLAVNEIFCRPKNLTLARPIEKPATENEKNVIEMADKKQLPR